MFTCPHCENPGVGFIAKLLSNPIYPAVCRLCGKSSSKCANVIWIQLLLAVVFLATIPNLASATTSQMLGGATALLIVIVGQMGPMCRR